MTGGATRMPTGIGSDFVTSLVTLRVAISRMARFDTKVFVTRQWFSATFSARNSVNMTCDTFTQFVFTVAPSEKKSLVYSLITKGLVVI